MIRSVKDYQIPTIMKKLVKRDYLDIFEKTCLSENCPFSAIGYVTNEKRLILLELCVHEYSDRDVKLVIDCFKKVWKNRYFNRNQISNIFTF